MAQLSTVFIPQLFKLPLKYLFTSWFVISQESRKELYINLADE